MAASELPVACCLWIPVTTGAVNWPWLGPVLTPIAMLAGWWRVICLRQAMEGSRWIRSSRLPRFWARFEVAWSGLGLVVTAAVLLGYIGPEPGLPTQGLLHVWRLATAADMGLAILWVMREAAIRESSSVRLLMAGAGLLVTLGVCLQWIIGANPDLVSGNKVLAFALFVLQTGIGVTSGLLVADGVGRVLRSETDEVLDPPSP
jgi:hypothetical protein